MRILPPPRRKPEATPRCGNSTNQACYECRCCECCSPSVELLVCAQSR
jgi:hypothetical protein